MKLETLKKQLNWLKSLQEKRK